MGPLSWLFRAVGRAFGRTGVQQPTQIAQTRVLTPEERKQEVEKLTTEEQRYAGWRDVDSSWILSLNYNPLVPFAQMLVKRTRKIYTFGGMTLDTYRSWASSGSKGTFFNRYLKGRYTRWAGFNVTPPDVFSFASGSGSVPVTRR